jgi:enamine deaminase RidA (YjgF/YER057c/UK114 family)
MTTKTLVAGLALALTMAGAAVAAPAKTVPSPGATAEAIARSPISAGALVSAGSTIFFVSGIPGAAAAGNTEAQTTDSLTKLKAVLEANGFKMADVANAKVYLVGDPAMGGKMDFAGMNKAFMTFFGTPENPTKPSRVTVQIAALAGAGSLVEIELTAVK